jgi:2-amino-4-hydroxy-6-hydroxymethyldihydropteridine diphosphokinase
MPQLAYLSLGSNLGDRAKNLRDCMERLGELGEVSKVSSFYETEPMEVREQPWFLNCAVELKTDLSPQDLLAGIRDIEALLGRERRIGKGPRTIDIDILLLGDLVMDAPDLQVPHPTMHERRFVLAPLAEIAPEILHPRKEKSAAVLLSELSADAGRVRRLGVK